MTQLFIRFYIGVICILFVALCIMSFAFRNRFDADFDRIKEKAMGKDLTQARDVLKARRDGAGAIDAEKLQKQFKYPIRVLADDHTSDVLRQLLSKGDEVVVHTGNELSVLIPFEDGTDAIQLGPIVLPRGSIETDMQISLGAVLLLVAIAIALLLRPLAGQLNVLERAAISIAAGNLEARVDVQSAPSARTLVRAFNDMAARIESLLRAQRELLQAVSHELRTPLARITFAIDLIRSAQNDLEREPRLRSLDSAAQELDELVGELLQYVRLETSGTQSACENIDLLPLVEELIEKNSVIGGMILFEIGPELSRGDVRAVADRVGFARVLSNLLANARRFGRQRVIVEANASSAGTTIDVDDDGPGIPVADRARVFEPFARLDEAEHGVGLGLALVKRIVANHGGTIATMNSPLGGCRMQAFWPSSICGGVNAGDSHPLRRSMNAT